MRQSRDPSVESAGPERVKLNDRASPYHHHRRAYRRSGAGRLACLRNTARTAGLRLSRVWGGVWIASGWSCVPFGRPRAGLREIDRPGDTGLRASRRGSLCAVDDHEIRIQKGLIFAAKLRELVANYLPLSGSRDGGYENWTVASAALLARGSRTLEAIDRLSRSNHVADSAVLLRSLYEHVTTFAWLAVAPTKHLPMWGAWDATERVKVYDRLLQATGEKLIDDQSIAHFRELARKPNAPSLFNMAVAADKHWSVHFPDILTGPNEQGGFTGLYRLTYAYTSGYAHATPRGVNPVVSLVPETTGTLIVGGAEELDTPEIFTLGPVIFGMALFIASHALGWPVAGDIAGAFELSPDADGI